MRKYLVSGKYNNESEYRVIGLTFAFNKQQAIAPYLLQDRFIFFDNLKAREVL